MDGPWGQEGPNICNSGRDGSKSNHDVKGYNRTEHKQKITGTLDRQLERLFGNGKEDNYKYSNSIAMQRGTPNIQSIDLSPKVVVPRINGVKERSSIDGSPCHSKKYYVLYSIIHTVEYCSYCIIAMIVHHTINCRLYSTCTCTCTVA
jgi:hypothetical protein